jgi:hypothetical protein
VGKSLEGLISPAEGMILMETEKIIVDVFCPQCGKLNRIDFSAIQGPDKGNLQINCPCNSAIPISVDFRKYYRKDTKLYGTYANFANKKEKGKIQVINLSMKGIGFTVQRSDAFSVGDQLELNFALDDDNQSEINVAGTIRHITGNHVGCEFTSKIENLVALKSYLND